MLDRTILELAARIFSPTELLKLQHGKYQYGTIDAPQHYIVALGDIGIQEYAGKLNNPNILKMWLYSKIKARPDSVAWCAISMNSWLERTGIRSPRKMNARSYMKFGKEVKGLDNARKGDIIVFWRTSRRSWQGHVALYSGEYTDTHVSVLGGNQRNKVGVDPYPRDRILTIRRVIY